MYNKLHLASACFFKNDLQKNSAHYDLHTSHELRGTLRTNTQPNIINTARPSNASQVLSQRQHAPVQQHPPVPRAAGHELHAFL